MKKSLFAPVLVLATHFAVAADNFYVSNGETKIGEWNSNIIQTITKAETENVPLVMVGTAFGCSICANFKASIMPAQRFKDWIAQSPYYFVYAYSGSGWWTTTELKAFINIVGNGGLPRIGGYWKKKDGTVVKSSFTGGGVNVDYYINFWDKLFKDYNPNKNDQWDSTDDTQSGATDLGVPNVTDTLTDYHYMNATGDNPDKEDWFKVTLTQGKRYRFSLDNLTYENVAPKVVFSDPAGQVITAAGDEDSLFSGLPLVYTAETNGTYYLRFYYEGTEGRATYKLAYREFEEVAFTFTAADVPVKENATNAVLTIKRSGRITDSVTASIYTADGTALAGTNYTALSNTVVTFAANVTNQTVTIPITDIPGSQGEKQFVVYGLNPEDATTNTTCTVTIEDLDKPTDAKDPADDTSAGATAFTLTDEQQTIKALEGASRVLSSQDTIDWFVLNTMEDGKVYQIKVPVGAYSQRPETATTAPFVTLYAGTPGSDTQIVDPISLNDLEQTPFRYQATNTAPLYVKVANADTNATVYTYDLAWREWVLPIVSFTNNPITVTSAAKANKEVSFTLTRTKNCEEEIAVQVVIEGNDARIKTGTNTVTFAAGVESATVALKLLADGGMWTPDESVTLTIVEDGTVHQDTPTAVHEVTVILKSEMAEFDADDGAGNTNSNPANTKDLTISKRPTTRTNLTLNGSDKADWYSFPVEADLEYVFELVDVKPETEEPLPLQAEVLLPGESSSSLVAATNFIGQPFHFIPQQSGNVAFGIIKTSDEPASISYSLKYREWVPATIGLTTNMIEVSEFAASVRIPVNCTMDEPLPTSIAVKTYDGTAKAGEDYMSLDTVLSWDETSPTSSIKYATVNLKKLVEEYEGAFETFGVYLDFANSDALPGDITNLTVKVIEADAGAVGTFAISEYALNEEASRPYQTKSIPVYAGDAIRIKVVRTGGNAGKVGITLTWQDGTTTTGVMEDTETEVWLNAQIPDSAGKYVARQLSSVVLTTNDKAAKTRNGKLSFIISDNDATLQSLAQDKTLPQFAASGNAWYVNANGQICSRAATSAGETLSMTTTLKGPGTISFAKTLIGSGTLTITAGKTVLTLTEQDGIVSAVLPAGTQRVTISFKATTANSAFAITSFTFTPDDRALQVGTFYGDVMLNEQVRGLATLTASATGRVSGKFTMPSNQVWTVTGQLVDGETESATVRRARVTVTNATIVVANGGEIDVDAGNAEMTFDVMGSRNGWSDRPLTGLYAAYANLLGQELEYADEDGALTFKVSNTGNTRVSGTYNGKRISASVVPFARDGALWAVLVNGALPNGMLFTFTNTNDIWEVNKAE